MATKNARQTNFSPSSFLLLDPGSGMGKIQIRDPDTDSKKKQVSVLKIKVKTDGNAVPEVGLVLLVGELVERLLAQPEGGVQAVDLKNRGYSYCTLPSISSLRFLVPSAPAPRSKVKYVVRSLAQPEGGVQAVDLEKQRTQLLHSPANSVADP